MFKREGMHLANAVAALEGVVIAQEAHESVAFQYGEDKPGGTETYELDLSEKIETVLNGKTCYYVPGFRINEEGDRSLIKILLIDANTKIVPGEKIETEATLSPRKDKLTERIWEENKSEIRKRRGALGITAVGGAAFLGAGVVVGTIGIKKWVKNRR